MGVLRAVGTLDTAARTRQFARTWHRCLWADARTAVPISYFRKYYFSSVSVPADQEEDSLQELKRIAEAYGTSASSATGWRRTRVACSTSRGSPWAA